LPGSYLRVLDPASEGEGPESAPAAGAPVRAGTSSLLGIKFGNYSASELLGSGAMGEVYLGVHPEIDRRVAIKVMARDLADLPAMESRFIEEARAISRIKHPNIIDIYDFGRLPTGQPYYIMELLSGRSLALEMERVGALSIAGALPIVLQICRGLQVAHERGIVHRDLKPENVFLVDGEPMVAKLLDFGLAKFLPSDRRQTGRGVVLGTPIVIAPEQAAGRVDQIGPRTDLYSLGVVLFWMLAGRPPFDDTVPAILLSRHLDEPAPDVRSLRPGVPPRIAELLSRCLEKSPERRPSSAAEVARSFAEAAEGVAGAPALLEPAPRPAEPAPRSPRRGGTLRASSGEAGPSEVASERRASPSSSTLEQPAVARPRWLLGLLGGGLIAGAMALVLTSTGHRAPRTGDGPRPGEALRVGEPGPGAGRGSAAAERVRPAPPPTTSGVAPASAPTGAGAQPTGPVRALPPTPSAEEPRRPAPLPQRKSRSSLAPSPSTPPSDAGAGAGAGAAAATKPGPTAPRRVGEGTLDPNEFPSP
jgi:eukaryotic-like serine/threonine-protein kinase